MAPKLLFRRPRPPLRRLRLCIACCEKKSINEFDLHRKMCQKCVQESQRNLKLLDEALRRAAARWAAEQHVPDVVELVGRPIHFRLLRAAGMLRNAYTDKAETERWPDNPVDAE